MTTPIELQNGRIVVLGASRGLGRGVAKNLVAKGASVLAVARNRPDIEGAERRAGDVTDPTFVTNLLNAESPDAIVLAAGAAPAMIPLSQYDWEALSRCWNVDVKATFHVLHAALNKPLSARIVVFSSGAALHGSPLSGGYAGAKQTQRFLCQYARTEAEKRGLGLSVQAVLPQLNPNTELGLAGVRAYAEASGETPEAFVQKRFGDPLSPEKAGDAIAKLLTDAELSKVPELMLAGGGLKPL